MPRRRMRMIRFKSVLSPITEVDTPPPSPCHPEPESASPEIEESRASQSVFQRTPVHSPERADLGNESPVAEMTTAAVKDEETALKDEVTASNDEETIFKDEELGLKDEELGSKDEELDMGLKDADMGLKDEELGLKDEELGSKDEELGSKDEELGSKDEELGSKDEELGLKDEKLGSKDEELGSKDEELGLKDDETDLKESSESHGMSLIEVDEMAIEGEGMTIREDTKVSKDSEASTSGLGELLKTVGGIENSKKGRNDLVFEVEGLGVRLQCPQCDKVFQEYSNRDMHILARHSVKTYKCQLCDSSFSQMQQLRNHFVFHALSQEDLDSINF